MCLNSIELVWYLLVYYINYLQHTFSALSILTAPVSLDALVVPRYDAQTHFLCVLQFCVLRYHQCFYVDCLLQTHQICILFSLNTQSFKTSQKKKSKKVRSGLLGGHSIVPRLPILSAGRFGAFAGDNEQRSIGHIGGHRTTERSVFERHTEDQWVHWG